MKSITDYLKFYNLINDPLYAENLPKLVNLLEEIKNKSARVYIAGNGASASIASHIANDLTKATKIRAMTFHDPAIITCFGNDYEYENWIKECLKHYCEADDLVILISSSGKSKNILNAAEFCKENGNNLISFTGPRPCSNLVEYSNINFSVNSEIYNIIECIHMILLTAAIDQIHMVTLSS